MESALSNLVGRRAQSERGVDGKLESRRGGHTSSGDADLSAQTPYPCFENLTDDLSFIAASQQMLEIRRHVLQIAGVDVPVFISGESGVGKEVIAHMIHAHSTRSKRPFIKVNCAALPAELLESELFGYEQGAFTGAVRAKPGRFESAHRGTIFLDEIGEMSPHLQAKLLQVLQDGEFTRLGGSRMVDVDVRVVAASNIHVPEAIRSGRLRADLYYRLNVMAIHVPPLRERRLEIPLFLRYFHEKYGKKYQREPLQLSRQLVEAATRYYWPGNLRELENFVKRYVILGEADESLKELAELSGRQASLLPKTRGLKERLRGLKQEVEREAISDVLKRTHWCRKRAATVLGISYKALLYKIRQFHLDEEIPGEGVSALQRFGMPFDGVGAQETASGNTHAEAADDGADTFAIHAETMAIGARSNALSRKVSSLP